MNIIKNYLTQNDCYKTGRTIKPIGLQLHSIGASQNSATSLASYWNQPGIEACVHYCVDAEKDGVVYQFLPDNRRSWADGNFGNANLITVEIMESDYMRYTGGSNYYVTNETKFKEEIMRGYNNAVQFFAYKCKEYGWNPTAKLGCGLYVISSHDEGRRLGLSTAHVDPTHIWNRFGLTMDKFRSDVKNAMSGSGATTTSPSTSIPSFNSLVKVSTGKIGLKILASELNIRTDAGTEYPIISNTQTFYRKGDCVSVTGKKKDSNGVYWFKTALGYISGKYVEGWVCESNGKWWYVKEGYTWIANNWLQDKNYGDAWYYFGADGYMVTSKWIKWKGKDYYLKSDGVMATNCYIKSTVKNLYYWVDGNGVWDSSGKWNTSKPDLKKYSFVK